MHLIDQHQQARLQNSQQEERTRTVTRETDTHTRRVETYMANAPEEAHMTELRGAVALLKDQVKEKTQEIENLRKDHAVVIHKLRAEMQERDNGFTKERSAWQLERERTSTQASGMMSAAFDKAHECQLNMILMMSPFTSHRVPSTGA